MELLILSHYIDICSNSVTRNAPMTKSLPVSIIASDAYAAFLRVGASSTFQYVPRDACLTCWSPGFTQAKISDSRSSYFVIVDVRSFLFSVTTTTYRLTFFYIHNLLFVVVTLFRQ